MNGPVVIRRMPPGMLYASALAAAVLLLVVLLLVYRWGYADGDADAAELQAGQRLVGQTLERLQQENTVLREEAARLRRAAQVDKDAWAEIQNDIKSLQSERMDLLEELAFFKSVVTGSEVRGLQIRQLKLRAGEPRSYHYSLVLTREMKSGKVQKGKVSMDVTGTQAGESQRYALKALGGEPSLKLNIKHFQRLEGVLRLPDGFVPESVEILVKPQGKRARAVERRFLWLDILNS